MSKGAKCAVRECIVCIGSCGFFFLMKDESVIGVFFYFIVDLKLIYEAE